MNTDTLNILMRIEDKIDDINTKLSLEIANIKLDVAVCKTACKKKAEITKAKLTLYGTVIGSCMAIIGLVIQKVF